MKPVYFDPQKDLAPMPFDDHVCQEARQLRDAGLRWHPHVGCFVWDPENVIKQEAEVWLEEGPIFGPGHEGHMRINIACPRSLLLEALGRIAESVKISNKLNWFSFEAGYVPRLPTILLS